MVEDIGVPNSRNLELLSMATQTSPAVLKGKSSRTYIRPLQQDLNLDPVKDKSDTVSYVGFHPHFSSQSKNKKYAYITRKMVPIKKRERSLPARASEQGNVIGSVHVYIYIICTIFFCN